MEEAAHLNELNPKASLHIQWTETRRPRPVREWLRVAVFTKATVRTAVLGVIAPILCKHYEVTGHTFDPSLLTMLIATPAAFLIGAAFQRREKALQDLAEFRSVAVHLHRAFGLYGREETRAAGQRAVQVRFRARELAFPGALMHDTGSPFALYFVQGTFSAFADHLSNYEPRSLEEAYVAFQTIGAAIEQLRIDPPEHVNVHIETIIGRLLFDERTLFTRLETLRLV